MFLGKIFLGFIVVIVVVVAYCITARRRKGTLTGYHDHPQTPPAIATGAGCQICGNPQSPGSQFCELCGTKLPLQDTPLSCPRCSCQVNPGERFCEQCGASLTPSG